MENKTKMVAALAAVMDYLRTEEDIIMQSFSRAQPPVPAAAPPAQSPWALSGRQAQMQLRSMMQLKALR